MRIVRWWRWLTRKNPSIVIKNNFQKLSTKYSDFITPDILKDFCRLATGCSKYTIKFDDSPPYNKGRLAKIEVDDEIVYVSFSEKHIQARNSTIQSFPTAYIKWHKEEKPKKSICFYFLEPDVCECHPYPNIETPYLMFNYRIMATLGVEFLNSNKVLKQKIIPFDSVDDIIKNKDSLKGRNRSNNSSYITKNSDGITEIYAKTYGASKYESGLLVLAASTLVDKVVLYEIIEGNLTKLPKNLRNVLKSNKKIELVSTDKTQDKNLIYPSALRRSSYIFELGKKFGAKKCAFCPIDNPGEIAGAHIWPVANIDNATNLSEAKRTEAANDGDNGLWLCADSASTPDHHRMFDNHNIIISENGELKISSSLIQNKNEILADINIDRIESWILTPEFLQYLKKRDKILPPEKDYVSIAEIR